MRILRSAVTHTAVLAALVLMAALTHAQTSGTSVYTIPASMDATGATDVTRPLVDFFRSVPDGSTISFPAGGKYRVEGTLELVDRNNLTIEGNGATVFADTDGTGVVTDLRTRYHWRLTRGSNIVFRNLVVRGAHHNGGVNGDYVSTLEAQHGFDIAGTNGVTLDRVRITDVYGDFVHASRDPRDGLWTQNLTIINSHMERNGRQAIALTTVKGALIAGNTITDTRRATFDLEPDVADQGAIDIRIENNYIGPGRLMFIANAGADGRIENIEILNNRLDRTMSIDVNPPTNGTRRRGPFRVEGNVSSVSGGSAYSDGEMKFRRVDGVVVRNNVQRVKDYDAFFAGVAYYETCNVSVAGNDFTGADAEWHNFTSSYVCQDPIASTTDSTTTTTTSSTTTTSTTSTTTTTVPVAPTSTAVTESFSGSLNRPNPYRDYTISVGTGSLRSKVDFVRDKILTLTVLDQAGSVVSQISATNPVRLGPVDVARGTYTVRVSGSTKANFTLTVSYPSP